MSQRCLVDKRNSNARTLDIKELQLRKIVNKYISSRPPQKHRGKSQSSSASLKTQELQKHRWQSSGLKVSAATQCSFKSIEANLYQKLRSKLEEHQKHWRQFLFQKPRRQLKISKSISQKSRISKNSKNLVSAESFGLRNPPKTLSSHTQEKRVMYHRIARAHGQVMLFCPPPPPQAYRRS